MNRSPTVHRRIADTLALLAVLMFAACLVGLFFVELKDGSKEVILVVIGSLTGVLKDVYSYHFGSSADKRGPTPPAPDGGTAR